MKKFIIFFGMFMCILAGQQMAFAGQSIKAVPSVLSVKTEAGGEVKEKLTIINSGDIPYRVILKAQNYRLNSQGEIQFESRKLSKEFSPASWVSFSEQNFLLKPQEHKEVLLTIQVPREADPAEYSLLLVASMAPIQNKPGVSISVSGGIAPVMFVQVVDPITKIVNTVKKGEITGIQLPAVVESSPFVIGVKYKNTGNVHLDPLGEVSIADSKGKEVVKANTQVRIVVKGAERVLQAPVSDKLSWGKYMVSAKIWADSKSKPQEIKQSFYYFPLTKAKYIFIAVISLIGALYFLGFRVQFRPRLKRTPKALPLNYLKGGE